MPGCFGGSVLFLEGSDFGGRSLCGFRMVVVRVCQFSSEFNINDLEKLIFTESVPRHIQSISQSVCYVLFVCPLRRGPEP